MGRGGAATLGEDSHGPVSEHYFRSTTAGHLLHPGSRQERLRAMAPGLRPALAGCSWMQSHKTQSRRWRLTIGGDGSVIIRDHLHSFRLHRAAPRACRWGFDCSSTDQTTAFDVMLFARPAATSCSRPAETTWHTVRRWMVSIACIFLSSMAIVCCSLLVAKTPSPACQAREFRSKDPNSISRQLVESRYLDSLPPFTFPWNISPP